MIRAVVVLLALGSTAVARAGDPSPTLSYGGRELTLHSTALKEVTFLKVNVYEAALYLEDPACPVDSVLDRGGTLALTMTFLRDVGRDKLVEAWTQDLSTYCRTGCDSLVAAGDSLATGMTDLASGDRVAYVILPDRVDVLVKGERVGSLAGDPARRTIFAAFLGPQAPHALRKELRTPRHRK